jgi:nitrous oxidase accessory protein NosD
VVLIRKASVGLTVLVLALSVLLTVGVQPAKSSTKTIVVPDDCPTIQAAIDNANAGDTVWVKSGNYHQNVTIDKQLSLIGENSETTIIYGFRSYNILAPDTTIQINADNVLISDFTLTNCSVGISANGNEIRLVSNVIDCYSTGISFTGSNGTIANNTVTSLQYGDITIIGSNNNVNGNIITNGSLELEGSFNTIDMNSAERINLEKANYNALGRNNCSHLFLSENCSHNTVFGNVFDGEGIWNYGVRIWGSDNVFSENYFSNSSYGVSIGHTFFNSTRNKFYHNMFINNNEGHVKFTNSKWSDNFWNNGFEGNYYDDYTGVDDNRDGIGDSPYRVEETRYEESLGQEVTVVFFEDKYPLMAPYDIENNKVVVPPPEPFPTLLVTVASIVAVVLVGAGLLVYLIKRK